MLRNTSRRQYSRLSVLLVVQTKAPAPGFHPLLSVACPQLAEHLDVLFSYSLLAVHHLRSAGCVFPFFDIHRLLMMTGSDMMPFFRSVIHRRSPALGRCYTRLNLVVLRRSTTACSRLCRTFSIHPIPNGRSMMGESPSSIGT